jgi:hypothetical protein
MRVEAGDMICAANDVRIVNLLTGEQVFYCDWADDEEGSYQQIVMLPDGVTPVLVDGDFVKRVVLAPIKIELIPR